MSMERKSMIGRLKHAIKKIKKLLDLSINKWKIVSIIGSLGGKRRLSNPNRCCLSEVLEYLESDDEPGSARSLQRTTSYPSEDDVDKRAEAFIANFYRQLQLEREVSLELQNLRGNSFDSQKSP